MRDLRKHALDEYEDLYRDEQEMIKQGRNAEGKKKRKKRKRKTKVAFTCPGANHPDWEPATENKPLPQNASEEKTTAVNPEETI